MLDLRHGLTVGLTLSLALIFSNVQVQAYTEVNEGYPAIMMDYKMYVDAASEYCVFQYTHEGAVFFAELSVIRGGDLKARFQIKDPHGVPVMPYEFKEKAGFHTNNATQGYYAVCVDNDSKYSAKLIGYYMATYEKDGWDKFVSDLSELQIASKAFADAFTAVRNSTTEALKYMQHSRSNVARDYALLRENNYNVGFWSFVQFVIILVSGITQVVMIRQLFKDKPSYGKYKARL